MKNFTKLAFAAVVAGSALFAGLAEASPVAGVKNNLTIKTGFTDTNVNVRTDFKENGWNKSSSSAIKTDVISEYVPEVDGLEVNKKIDTTIIAESSASSMSDFSTNTHTNVTQYDRVDTLLDQTIVGEAYN